MIELTTKEFSILEYFMRNKNKILLAQIFQNIFGIIISTLAQILLDVYISHLREKVDWQRREKYFHTIRSVGYN